MSCSFLVENINRCNAGVPGLGGDRAQWRDWAKEFLLGKTKEGRKSEGKKKENKKESIESQNRFKDLEWVL